MIKSVNDWKIGSIYRENLNDMVTIFKLLNHRNGNLKVKILQSTDYKINETPLWSDDYFISVDVELYNSFLINKQFNDWLKK